MSVGSLLLLGHFIFLDIFIWGGRGTLDLGTLFIMGHFGDWGTLDFGTLLILGHFVFWGSFDFGVLFILGYFFYFMELLIYGNF